MSSHPSFISTTNACKMCTPLGAAMAFKGIQGCVPFLHGSQGCATYMRRYIISHFREPVDIASSSLGEKHAVYGGGPNLKKGILNVMQKYGASVVGVATTCLTETIGDDVPMILHEFKKEFADLDLPELVWVSTPSYGGTHMEGFHAAVKATVEQLSTDSAPNESVNLFPGFVSPADIRYLKAICRDFGLPVTILPDISETLDGPVLEDYQKIPSGGTPVEAIRSMAGARASIEFGRTAKPEQMPGASLNKRNQVPVHRLGLPVGIRESDALFTVLEELSGRPTPGEHAKERGRLVDALVDGHKYVSGKRAVVYGEEDMVLGLTALLAEIGVHPVLVATGGEPLLFEEQVLELTRGLVPQPPVVRKGVDFFEIGAEAEALSPDLVVGNSKGYRLMSRSMGVPLIRTGFPIHDRFGAQRVLHLGYRGAQELFDRIVNAVIERKQNDSDVGYGYI